MIKTGTFVSTWENGTVETRCKVNLETGEIVERDRTDGCIEMGCLIQQYIELDDEDEGTYEVCMVCHDFILHSVMLDDQFKNYTETFQCMNPFCESNR